MYLHYKNEEEEEKEEDFPFVLNIILYLVFYSMMI
jgi:hypothetical protein